MNAVGSGDGAGLAVGNGLALGGLVTVGENVDGGGGPLASARSAVTMRSDASGGEAARAREREELLREVQERASSDQDRASVRSGARARRQIIRSIASSDQ